MEPIVNEAFGAVTDWLIINYAIGIFFLGGYGTYYFAFVDQRPDWGGRATLSLLSLVMAFIGIGVVRTFLYS